MNFSILRSWWTLLALVVSLVLTVASYDQWFDRTCRQPAIAQMTIESMMYAYVLDSDGDLNVVRVLGTPLPQVISASIPLPAPARDLSVSGKTLFLAAGDAGLFVVDVSDPNHPRLAGQLPVKAQTVAVSGARAYVLDKDGFLDVLEVSNPAAPTLLGSISAPGARIHVSGSDVYLAAGDSGLIIVNAKTASSPAIVSTMRTPGRVEDVASDGRFAYVADGTGGLLVVNVSDPAQPEPVATLPVTDSAQRVIKDNQFLYLTGSESGLHVIHVLDPAAPNEVNGLPDLEPVVSMAKSLGVLVFATQSGQLLSTFVLNPCNAVASPTPIPGIGPATAIAMVMPYSMPVTSVFPGFRIWASVVFPLIVLLRLAFYRHRVARSLNEPVDWKSELALWIGVTALLLLLADELRRQTL